MAVKSLEKLQASYLIPCCKFLEDSFGVRLNKKFNKEKDKQIKLKDF